MLSFIKDNNCTGCTACKAACPKQCISMERESDGFLYPSADAAQCIQCGLCEKVCPQYQSLNLGFTGPKEAFAGVIKNPKIWKRSTSGGAFSAICEAWNFNDACFVGAAWDGFQIKHVCVDSENLDLLRKSKYVFSEMGDLFQEIRAVLNQSRNVVFSGTPCQVAGLRSFLGKDYDNLLTIDLICHGVGSPLVFQHCLRSMESQLKMKISEYEFRSKRKVFETDYLSKLVGADSTGRIKTKYVEKDPYNQLFLSQLCLRDSCGKNCRYRTANRVGDITIADFKGLKEVFPNLKGTKQNYSSIIINSAKGKKVLESLNDSMALYKCRVEDIERFNPLFGHQTWFAEKKNDFWRDFTENPDKAIAAWTKPAVERKLTLKRRIYGSLPVLIRRMLE